MKIGTPLSPSATRVMLLGSHELGKEMVIACTRLGIEVIAVDNVPNAPGHQIAYHSHVCDMNNAKALRELIIKEQPHFIVPISKAIATDVLVEIEKTTSIKVIPTARAVSLALNRENLRQLATETLDLPTPRYAFARSYNELQMQINRGVGYPCIVKPIQSSSGQGHSIINDPDDVKLAWNHAMNLSNDSCDAVIVEEFIKFDYEITLLTVRAKNGEGDVETHFCEPIGYLKKDGYYTESWQPQRMTPTSLSHAHEMAQTLTEHLGGCGIFGVEFLVKGEQVWFNEVSPYPHYSGMVTMVTQAQNQFELHLRALLGLPVSTTLREQGACSVIYGVWMSEM
ncbi:Phosphoribosylglycinamide formyltransferase 2 [Beggiatoa sp. PS]|nr:Phosphoribosylglycinamide formyltransferase 2 [Beggiatoa sp. PS]